MKKLLILSIALFTLFSCSSNENETTQDPIIGTWMPLSSNGEEVSDCEKQSRVTLNENNTFTSTPRYENGSGDCIVEGQTSGEWVNKGNNVYGTKTSEETEYTDATIIFSDSNNTFTVTAQDDNGNTEEVEVFTRVN